MAHPVARSKTQHQIKIELLHMFNAYTNAHMH